MNKYKSIGTYLWQSLYNIAPMYAKQNKIEEAVDWLKKAVKHGFRDREFLKKDKDLKNIRGFSYFKELTMTSKNHFAK